MSHLDGSLGLVQVEHDHPSAVLQLDRCHVDGRKHVLEGDLHQSHVRRGVLVAEVVENNLSVVRESKANAARFR